MSQYRRFTAGGFPHSDISGLKPACGSPKLFAACHVLHRHVSPRHPPVALRCLFSTCSFFKYGLPLDSTFTFRILSLYFFTSLITFSRIHTVKELNPIRNLGPGGLEPPTPRLSSVCSNQLSYEPSYGGAERVRTDDLLNANQPLFQLSYGPFTLQRVTQSPAPTPYRLPSLSMNSRSSKITKYDRTYLHPHSHTLTLVSVRTSP